MKLAASTSYRAAGALLVEQDDPEPEYWRCACGAFLPAGPTSVGNNWMAWYCRRCKRVQVIEEPPARTEEGRPF